MTDPADFAHFRATLSTGRTYHYVDQRPVDRAHTHTLLCLHGFPDLWYGWKNQIHPWVAEGYRVVVPDMLGYGRTDMPSETSAYTTKSICGDLAALLDHLGVQKAVVIGHDWGSFVSSRFALWYPQRLLALISLSVPYMPPQIQYIPVHEMAQHYPPFGYQVYFASEESTAEIEANLPLFFRLAYMTAPYRKKFSWLGLGQLRERFADGTAPDECMLDEKDFEHYVSNFKRGMHGPLSYYRTGKARFEEERDAALPSKLQADLPVLIAYGTKDGTCSPMALQNSGKFIDKLEVVPLPNLGHFVMLEAPQRVTEIVKEWLESTLGPRASVRL